MKILALECSAGPASCAVIENGNVIASDFTNVKMTHSQTSTLSLSVTVPVLLPASESESAQLKELPHRDSFPATPFLLSELLPRISEALMVSCALLWMQDAIRFIMRFLKSKIMM